MSFARVRPIRVGEDRSADRHLEERSLMTVSNAPLGIMNVYATPVSLKRRVGGCRHVARRDVVALAARGEPDRGWFLRQALLREH